MKVFSYTFIIGVLCAFLFTACASQEAGNPSQSKEKAIPAEVSAAINDAIKAANRAESVLGLWLNTEKTIGKAKKAAKAGKYDKALKLAAKAKWEGDMGYNQAVAEKKKYDHMTKNNIPFFK